MTQTWGIIGFGEAGSAFAAHILQAGGIRLLLNDPVLTEAAEVGQLIEKLDGTLAEVVEDIPSLVRSAGLCLSLVTPRAAVDVARLAASAWEQGLFIDLNSVSPLEKSEMAAFFPRGVFVGGAILGSIAGEGSAASVVLDGPSAEYAQVLLNSAGFHSNAISGTPGAAAALKICRSVFMKGIECLLVEMLLAASGFQIAGAVLDSIENTLNSYGFRAMVEMLVSTHAVHCVRRADEMQRVAAVLADMRLPNLMSEASRALLSLSGQAGVTEHFGGKLPSGSDTVIEYLQKYFEDTGQASSPRIS